MDGRNLGFADKVGRGLTNGILFVTRRWKLLMLSYVFVATLGSALLYVHNGQSTSSILFLFHANIF